MSHLELVTIVVDDYDQAIDFFVDVLGFDLVDDSPSLTNDGRPKRWVVVRPPDARTGILLARADGARQAASSASKPPAWWASSFGSTTSKWRTDACRRQAWSSWPRRAPDPVGGWRCSSTLPVTAGIYSDRPDLRRHSTDGQRAVRRPSGTARRRARGLPAIARRMRMIDDITTPPPPPTTRAASAALAP